MLDIVDRLRNAAALPTGLYAEAADEIVKLRGAVIVAREAFSKYADHSGDKDAALRLATLKLAAEIGRRMP